MKHPLSGAIYELSDDGVQVTRADGSVGTFDSAGHWLSGERFAVDKHMCEWIGDGPRQPDDLSTNRRFRSIIQEEKTL